MRHFNILVLALIFLSAGCGKKKDYSSFFVVPDIFEENIVIDSIIMDTLSVAVPNSSYVGFSNIHGDRIFFADKYFCWVYEFDKEALLADRHMGQGRGPQELPLKNIIGYAIGGDNTHYFVGSTRDLYIYDSTFNLQRNITFLPKSAENETDVFERDDFYSLNYDDMIMRPWRGHIYFNVTGGNSEYNISNLDYYENSRILMSINAENGDIENTMGRISPAVKYMSAFRGNQYDMDEDGNFFVSFEADSLIYVYDNNFDIKYSFGIQGRGMNTNYLELQHGESYRTQSAKERASKGYYTSIKKTGKYVFRTYKTGGDLIADRMQIYENTTLIGDVVVPPNFKIMGYIAPYYYSQIITNENDETLTLFKFEINGKE